MFAEQNNFCTNFAGLNFCAKKISKGLFKRKLLVFEVLRDSHSAKI